MVNRGVGPKRVQRSRQTKGSMIGAVYVGRGRGEWGRFGNPFEAVKLDNGRYYVWDNGEKEAIDGGETYPDKGSAIASCLVAFNESLRERLKGEPDFLLPLKGKNLACWCPLNQPCHADILLELANR